MSADLVGFSLMKELAILSQGRNPQWVEQPSNTGAPTTINDGVSVEGAIVTMVALGLRRESHVFTSVVTVTGVDLTTSVYTVTVNGNAVNYDTSVSLPADQDALVNGIRDAINADGTVGLVVVASSIDEDGDGVLDTILLKNILGETVTHTTAVGATGSGALTFTEDATGCDLRVWVLPDQSDDISVNQGLSWLLVNGGTFTGIDFRGFLERFETSGSLRMYGEVLNVLSPSGGGETVNLQIGPAGQE